MYHYVREYDDKYPNFRFLDIKNFRIQLDYLSETYGFSSKTEWSDFLAGKEVSNYKEKVILTFDDAMRCHFEYVFPELERRNLWGIFYVPTMPYTEARILDVHKIHLLCGAFEGNELLETLLSLITDTMIPDSKCEEFRSMTYSSQTNYEGVTEFKRILNYFIDYEFRNDVINSISDKFNYTFDSNSFYIPQKDLLKMKEHGHIIGSHTVNHPVMSKLSHTEQLKEIESSFNFLDKIQCTTYNRTYCHPYGGFHSFNDDTVDILTNNKVQFSFNVESRDITVDDVRKNPQFLPRYDCNEFPHGMSSPKQKIGLL